MRINSLSNILSFSAGKISRLTLKIFSVINFFFHNVVSEKRNEAPVKSATCNVVAFRLDDIPYDWPIYDEARIDVDLAVMDVFVRKKQNLTVGLLMRYLELHPKLLKNVLDGYRNGIFELALHGWDHDDYSKLNKKDQESSLLRAKTRFNDLFGSSSKIFIPPYNRFNRSTLHVMKKLELNIISSSVYSDYHLFFMRNRTKKISPSHIYHVPEMISFETFHDSKPIRNSLTQIFSDIERHISKYGYAIITIHPQSFVKFTEGKSTQLSLKESKLDTDQIAELEVLLQMILDRNISIKSFSKLLGKE
jgi:peptidoglycan/xylan/chitin deacetylase (PgdA/CDA1 family)